MAQPATPQYDMKAARRHEAACPGSAGILPAWTTAGLRPVAGRRPALPGRRPRRTFTANCRNGSIFTMWFGRSSSRQNLHGPAGHPATRKRPGITERLVLGARASCPHGQPRAFGPLRARGPRSQEDGPDVLSREIVVTVRYSPCGPEGHRLAKTLMPSRPPRNMKTARRHEAACPGSAGILPAWTTAGLRPVAGRRPALPGRRPIRTFTGNCRNGSVALLFRNPVQPELCVGGGAKGRGTGRTDRRPPINPRPECPSTPPATGPIPHPP